MSNDAEKEEGPSCWASKKASCAHCCKHEDVNDDGEVVTLYLNNTAGNWVYIIGGLMLIWIGLGLMCWALLAIVMESGLDALYGT
jgi:hypothetical protein